MVFCFVFDLKSRQHKSNCIYAGIIMNAALNSECSAVTRQKSQVESMGSLYEELEGEEAEGAAVV